ncbi:hypothetical protein PIB30_031722 [Stylosanthes scabra]|uniref:Reverse transcriptase zinc-binding domain-containing protein n=1 Tax=Stylosanthes scabra TaxID=79078 RepID=A0ABU6TBQ1_9FABA|nr:hypothetical protein [Stylosanthes scabra]
MRQQITANFLGLGPHSASGKELESSLNSRIVPIPVDVQNRILSIKLEDNEDCIQWAFNKSHRYDVSSTESCPAYFSDHSLWVDLWKSPIPHKIKILLWKCLHERLPTLNLLHHRFPQTPPTCNCKMRNLLPTAYLNVVRVSKSGTKPLLAVSYLLIISTPSDSGGAMFRSEDPSFASVSESCNCLLWVAGVFERIGIK